MEESSELRELEQQLASGEPAALDGLLTRYRPRLKRMIDLRMDRRLRGRVDPSDVIQDACLQASARIGRYLEDRPMPFFLWLRFLVGERLIALQRHHLGTAKRDAGREISLYHAALPEASSAMLAAQLVGSLTSPSQLALRAERRLRLQEALNQMQPIDREIIALRHFEQLSRAEAAKVLGIQRAAASKRYVRAMDRLRSILDDARSATDE